MSTTKNLNQPKKEEKKEENKSNVTGQVLTGAGAMAAGAAAAYTYAKNDKTPHNEDHPVEKPQEVTEVHGEEVQEIKTEPAGETATTATQQTAQPAQPVHPAANSTAQHVAQTSSSHPGEPTPQSSHIGQTQTAQQSPAGNTAQQTAQNQPTDNPTQQTPGETTTTTPSGEQTTGQNTQQPVAQNTIEVENPENLEEPVEVVVDPHNVAEAIIAGDEIDPDDIDAENLITFQEIETINTVEGETYLAARFEDAAGNQLVMVDIDGDETFDTLGDPMTGTLMTGVDFSGISVDDAQMALTGDHEYLPASDDQIAENLSQDSIDEDILQV